MQSMGKKARQRRAALLAKPQPARRGTTWPRHYRRGGFRSWASMAAPGRYGPVKPGEPVSESQPLGAASQTLSRSGRRHVPALIDEGLPAKPVFRSGDLARPWPNRAITGAHSTRNLLVCPPVPQAAEGQRPR